MLLSNLRISLGTGRSDRIAAVITVAGLSVSLVLGFASDGVYHDDDITHFLLAHDAWKNVDLLLHWWARPGYNFPAMAAAHLFGMAGCRVLSAAMTAGTAWFAYLIASRFLNGNPIAAWAPAFVWLQPLAIKLSATTLTETPAAFYLAMGVWLFTRGNRASGCAAMSLMFITRFETMALAPIPFLLVLREEWRDQGGRILSLVTSPRVWASSLAIMWAPLAYAAATALFQVSREASVLFIFSRSYPADYGTGAWYHFLAVWSQAASLGVLALGAAGAGEACVRRAFLPLAMTLGFISIQSILFFFGLFATGGYSRFLVTVSGTTAVLAACGVASLWRGNSWFPAASAWAALAAFLSMSPKGISRAYFSWGAVWPVLSAGCVGGWLAWKQFAKRHQRWCKPISLVSRGTLVLALAGAGVQTVVQVRPLKLMNSPVRRVVGEAVEAAKSPAFAGRPVLACHVMARYLLENCRVISDRQEAMRCWKTAAPGTLFLWDSKYCSGKYPPAAIEESKALLDALHRFGARVFKSERGGASAALYERLPVPPAPHESAAVT